MRKHMTLIYDELLCRNPRVVYIGIESNQSNLDSIQPNLTTPLILNA